MSWSSLIITVVHMHAKTCRTSTTAERYPEDFDHALPAVSYEELPVEPTLASSELEERCGFIHAAPDRDFAHKTAMQRPRALFMTSLAL